MSPMLLVLIPLVMAPLIYILRRLSPLAALLSAATTLATMRLCFEIPLNEPAQVLGRELVFDPPSRFALLFLFAVATASLPYAWQVSQGQLFSSLILMALGLIAGAIMIRNFLIAALLLEMAALIIVFLIQGDREGSTRGALGYLVAIVVAIPCLLLTSWLFDLYAFKPEDLALVRYIVILLALGFGILLAVVPFHLWFPTVAAEAPPMATASLISIFEPTVLFLFLGLLRRFPWLATESQIPSIMTLGGLLTALVGGTMAFLQRDLGRLWGYSAISDLGCILVGLGTASTLGVAGALLHIVNRSISALLVAMCLGAIRRCLASDSFADLHGAARGMPLTTMGLIVGGLAMGGFPLSNGFAGRRLIYSILMQQDPTRTYMLMLASAGVVLGYARAIRALFGVPRGAKVRREPKVVAAMILTLTLLSLAMGLYPQLALEPILELIKGFAFIQ